MNFTETLVANLSQKHLLNHEHYQLWNEGKIPLETLQTYAQQYYHHVKTFPRYVSATHSRCDKIEDRQVLLDNLIDEEKGAENHPELWLRFAEGLGAERSTVQGATLFPETKELVDFFMGACQSSYAEGLGALFAYEHQIPAIASFKKKALTDYYGINNPSTLSFFDVHSTADVYHTQALSHLMNNLSTVDKEKAEKTARIAADQLWKFLDGIHKTICTK